MIYNCSDLNSDADRFLGTILCNFPTLAKKDDNGSHQLSHQSFLPDPRGAGHVEAFQILCVCVCVCLSGHLVNSIMPNSQLLKAWAL